MKRFYVLVHKDKMHGVGFCAWLLCLACSRKSIILKRRNVSVVVNKHLYRQRIKTNKVHRKKSKKQKKTTTNQENKKKRKKHGAGLELNN